MQSAAKPETRSKDSILEVLSNQRRRFTIHYLKQQNGEQVTVSELAEQVASWEYGKDPGQLTHQERKRVRNALRQFHLQKMAEHGFVEYDSQRGTVRLSEMAQETNIYLDSLTGREIPWGLYYLGLSALYTICLTGLLLGLPPFTVFSPLTWGVFSVTALVISSLCHFYDNYYRMRLGARDKPPEVEEQ